MERQHKLQKLGEKNVINFELFRKNYGTHTQKLFYKLLLFFLIFLGVKKDAKK